MYPVGQKVTLTVNRRKKPALTLRGEVIAVLENDVGYQVRWEGMSGQWETSLVGVTERGFRAVEG